MQLYKSICLGAVLLLAVTGSSAGGYLQHPQARALIDELVSEEGFQRKALERLFAQAQRQDKILEAISRPAEKTKAWHDYRQIFVTPRRIQQGLAFYRQYAADLQRAEREYGVPADIIVAIIGVETRYGRNKGSWRTLDALATLAFDYPQRAPFFRSELKHYLLLAREQQLPVLELQGSYAGAMGYGQFMPSSWRNHAVDFDGDGRINLFDRPVDAIGSVANYCKQHGWRAGAPVAQRARLHPGYRQGWLNAGLKPVHSAAELLAAGIHPVGDFSAADTATAMELVGENGPEYWLGWHNFYVITRYNHSAMYAMSVYQLSQEIAAGWQR